MGEDLRAFIRTVRARSDENGRAIALLQNAGLYGPLVGILRHEVDSFIRVVYLVAISDLEERAHLIHEAIHGRKWYDADGNRIFEAQMVDHAVGPHGWVRALYEFGCGFVHLSNNHDYLTRDPFRALPPRRRQEILDYLRSYHGVPATAGATFEEILSYAPAVFEKVRDNMEPYLRDLEEERVREKGAA